MRKLSFILVMISLCFYQCVVDPLQENEDTMDSILSNLDLICNDGPFSTVREASNVTFKYCLNSTNSNSVNIIEGDQINFNVSMFNYFKNTENNCMEEEVVILNERDSSSINNLNTGDRILEFQDCINLIQKEHQMIHCLFNKGHISSLNGIENAFTLIVIDSVEKI